MFNSVRKKYEPSVEEVLRSEKKFQRSKEDDGELQAITHDLGGEAADIEEMHLADETFDCGARKRGRVHYPNH